ncbi:hypothetical protein [Aureispira sp. CCB-QB1]|uniref:hypothetical protein n=1 Tax=Aureispira sp. CCB-QB1 TaxID=1313421 RepID=UPI0006973318|nr:hypothetical protein [Aureispira sp. CCB-QB1]
MPSTPINQLPVIGTVTLDDVVIVEQTIGSTTTTHQATVRQLVGGFSPVPTITNLTWDAPSDGLTIQGDNLLPTTLVLVNDIPYRVESFEYGAAPNPNNNATIYLEIASSLPSGIHTVKVKNFVHEATDTFTI